MSHDDDDRTIYNVVVNHEEQYSIWPADREIPLGWRAVGKHGQKHECLEYVKEVWTDMRPLSLRKEMEELERRRAQGIDEPTLEAQEDEEWNRGPSLVERLSTGRHRITASLRPERTSQALKECIERGYVHIRFTDTRGGTELGVRLDKHACNLSQADFANSTGSVSLVGGLTLDFVQVRCFAELDLATLQGEGYLQVVNTPAGACP